MRPSLYLLKKHSGRSEYSRKTEVQVVVVDLDKSKQYPLNFVCILPQTTGSLGKPSSIWQSFWCKQLEVAHKLLYRALKKEKDEDVRKELTKRLRALKSYSGSQIMIAN